ncbi:amino acid ABC transporter ATP-binding protein, PAAT family [Limimonas halophila]|uniref:Amino acid ABC transporter ATP-binding protein, PAAT family n=1 Tax=Limimonas halophila TaxID=1082479 RepID=A0A1G7U0A6_9PROT|nr:phosphate ABC transporter ATP-binding protein [Limimonas halophila]SDG40972.1 amino acid ABC transporter ATP-binding protein, PAAT family [Limimonas halophila]
MPRDTAPESDNPLLPLDVRGVRLRRGDTPVLDGLDMHLAQATRSVLIGPNGAGKSVTLRVLHGLIEPDAGAVRWAGQPPARAVRMRQAMVFQRPVMLRRSAAANVAYALRVHGVPRRERRRRVAEELDRAGLAHLARRPAPALSGGEQQRLAIARAWATRPAVMLLDEPTANLDPAGAHAVEALIAEIHASGAKIVMTTHDMAQARRLGEDVLFMHRGRLVEHTPAETFFTAPRTDDARAFAEGRLLL